MCGGVCRGRWKGDCGTVEQRRLLSKFVDLFDQADENKVIDHYSLSDVVSFYNTNAGVGRSGQFRRAECAGGQEQGRIPAASHLRCQDAGTVRNGGFGQEPGPRQRRVQGPAHRSRQEPSRAAGTAHAPPYAKYTCTPAHPICRSCLQATAQVASQEGKYLGQALNALARGQEVEQFHYKPLGSLAYIGARESGTGPVHAMRSDAVLEACSWSSPLSAVLELPGGFSFGGFTTWFAWRSAYLAKQVRVLGHKLGVSGC